MLVHRLKDRILSAKFTNYFQLKKKLAIYLKTLTFANCASASCLFVALRYYTSRGTTMFQENSENYACNMKMILQLLQEVCEELQVMIATWSRQCFVQILVCKVRFFQYQGFCFLRHHLAYTSEFEILRVNCISGQWFWSVSRAFKGARRGRDSGWALWSYHQVFEWDRRLSQQISKQSFQCQTSTGSIWGFHKSYCRGKGNGKQIFHFIPRIPVSIEIDLPLCRSNTVQEVWGIFRELLMLPLYHVGTWHFKARPPCVIVCQIRCQMSIHILCTLEHKPRGAHIVIYSLSKLRHEVQSLFHLQSMHDLGRIIG